VKNKNVVFIILNYKQYMLTVEAIQNILFLKGDIGIVVVDNNSNDGSYEKLRKIFKKYKKVKIFQNYKNTGYANGNNFGVKKAYEIFNPDYIAIMNPDVRIYDKKIVHKLLDAFSKNNKIAIATGFMLDINKKLSFNNIAWKIPKGLDDIFLNVSFLRHIYNPVLYRAIQLSEDGLFHVEVVPGSFFVIRREVFEKIGKFDEKTFLSCEERILGWKLKKEGFISTLVPGCFFFHNHSEEKQSLLKKYNAYSFLIKSKLHYNLKYNSELKIIILPLFILSALIGYIERTFVFLIKYVLEKRI